MSNPERLDEQFALSLELARELRDMRALIEREKDRLSPVEWATMIEAKAQVVLALSKAKEEGSKILAAEYQKRRFSKD